MNDALHAKYRPKKFSDVVGQDAAVASLTEVVKQGSTHAFLFEGPSGVGKTTLARITARASGCKASNVREIDAATYTGIDDMRNIQTLLQYEPFGESKGRAVIIDECHSLSKNAWQSLLKIVEEPPAHVFWFFCTTEPGKVPKTIQSRCATYTLRAVHEKALRALYNKVADAEGIELDAASAELIIGEAGGSPRQLLVSLDICRHAKDKKQVADLVRSAQGSATIGELCQFLIRGGSWQKAMEIISRLDGEAPESVRIVVSNYFAAVVKNAKSDKSAVASLAVLEAFEKPYNQSDKLAPLILSIGRVLFSGG
jgi:DNA polymerase-3 subunit gamma/tau